MWEVRLKIFVHQRLSVFLNLLLFQNHSLVFLSCPNAKLSLSFMFSDHNPNLHKNANLIPRLQNKGNITKRSFEKHEQNETKHSTIYVRIGKQRLGKITNCL